MGRYGPRSATGYFLPITDIYDAKAIYDLKLDSPEFKDFLVRLQQRINTMSIFQNFKTVGIYPLDEQVCGKQYFTTAPTTTGSTIFRQVYRKTFDVGALPFPSPKIIPTGLAITADYKATDIYGTATNPGVAMIPLPFASTVLNENIKLEVIGTDIVITTAIDYSAYTDTYITLEYVKN